MPEVCPLYRPIARLGSLAGWFAIVMALGASPLLAQTTCPIPGTIQHVIFLVKDNRTFDNYFGKFPGANGATTALDSSGAIVPLHVADDTNFGCDIDHGWKGAHNAYACGFMSQFDLLTFSGTSCDRSQAPPYTNHSLTQFSQADIPNYWSYAQHFTLADNMFSSLMGPSYPNHLFTVAAQAGGPATGAGAVNNPTGGTGTSHGWGCDMTGQTVATIPFGGPVCPASNTFGSASSCWDFQTLPDEIDAAPSLTWRYYAPQPGGSGYIWSALNAINHIRNNPVLWGNVVPYTQFITDAATPNKLPSVSWIVLPGSLSEHAPSSVCAGENYTVQLLNALMNGDGWCTSAVFITWDDYGGFYDHVPPSTSGNADVYGPGFRVPLLVVSPYARTGFVDSVQYDFSSLLKFAEVTFSLPALTARDLNANDLMHAFNFNHVTSPLILTQRTCPASSVAAPSKVADDFDD